MSHHEHPNVALCRRLATAFNSGDLSTMGDGLSDDVEWHEIGSPEPIRGKAALMERWPGMANTGGTFSVKEHAVVGDDTMSSRWWSPRSRWAIGPSTTGRPRSTTWLMAR